MKLLLTSTLICFLMACGIPDRKSKEISKDLIPAFNHKDIVTSIENHRVSVSFFKYDMRNKPRNELRELATRVKERVLNRITDLKNIYVIEVRFTEEEDGDELENLLAFNFRVDALKKANQ